MACFLWLSACEHVEESRGPEIVGGTSGALIGAQIGAGTGQLVAIGVGAVAGAIAGRVIADESTHEPQLYNESQTLEKIVPQKLTATSDRKGIKNPTASHPQNKIKNSRCHRQYTYRGVIDGKPVKIYGTAHLSPDGIWYVPDHSNTFDHID